MEKFQAPHEKLTEEEINSAIEKLLSNTLKMKDELWARNDDKFFNLVESNEEAIFKLRRHFRPELTTIMKVSIAELSDMMGEAYDKGI